MSEPADHSALSLLEARARIRQVLVAERGEPLCRQTVESVRLHDALERILAEDLISPIDVPAQENSAMDGYAIRAADLARDGVTRFTVIGSAMAGRPFDGTVQNGQAIRIMTGANLPTGLDTVVVQEAVRTFDADVIEVPAGQPRGNNCRSAGEDLARGQAALPAGRRLTPADLGLAASLGVARLPVRRRLRVALVSTGSELIELGAAVMPTSGQRYDSNRYTLHAMLQRLGCEAVDFGIAGDSAPALEAILSEAAAQTDVIVSSGGVSVGEADLTRALMARLGSVEFASVALRPGRPFAFGRIGHTPYFGLPGNPVAVIVTFYFLVRDALRELAGELPRPDLLLRARAAEPMRKRAGRTEYLRGVIECDSNREPVVRLTGDQGAGILSSMSRADCIVALSHERGPVQTGDWVDVIALNGLL